MRKLEIERRIDGSVVMSRVLYRKIRRVLRAAEGARRSFPSLDSDRILRDAVDALNKQPKK